MTETVHSSPRWPADPVPFPVTHLSLLRRVRSADADTRIRALDALAEVYWAPIYTHIRLTHGQPPTDAEDLTQGFLANALRRDLFARYEPERARFRTFVRRCVDSYVANELQAARRQKRGGEAQLVSIDTAQIEERLTTDESSNPDAVFHQEWVRSIMVAAVERLRERYRSAGRPIHLEIFERYHLAPTEDDRPTYAELAASHAIPVTQVTNWLAAVRRDFRSIVIDVLRDLCGSDDEFREEARALLGEDGA